MANLRSKGINKEHDHEAYQQAKEDLVKLIHEFKGGKRGSKS